MVEMSKIGTSSELFKQNDEKWILIRSTLSNISIAVKYRTAVYFATYVALSNYHTFL